ncbi:MAG: hypothetical protein P8018_03535 [Acidobacteriota bacterium]
MERLLSGLYHWTTFHEGIRKMVHSYYIEAAEPAVLIDPRVPDEGLEWFEKRKKPEHIFLTNRHHYRHSAQFEEAFGSKVWCHRDGLHEFTRGERVAPFEHGDDLPGGIKALDAGVICPEETVLYSPVGEGTLAVGDSLVRYEGELGFVPDALLGEDPEDIKRGIKNIFLSHMDRHFDNLLFAHGDPWIGGAKEGLRRYLESLPY